MTEPYFKTDTPFLKDLLADCNTGYVQLPDFQRDWVWEEDRIVSLISSVSLALPIGALLMIETNREVKFSPRPIQGIESAKKKSGLLILDGQQRITSLFQATFLSKGVETKTSRGNTKNNWIYFKIDDAVNDSTDRENSIKIASKSKNGKVIRNYHEDGSRLELLTEECEYKNLLFPISKIFSWYDWSIGFLNYWSGTNTKKYKKMLDKFRNKILEKFDRYPIPIIILRKAISKENTCQVFEKVNTSGKSLDAFELVSAMFAGKGCDLRADWGDDNSDVGRRHNLARWNPNVNPEKSVLSKVQSTHFLQAISLMKTRDLRIRASARNENLPTVSGSRKTLLDLSPEEYSKYANAAEEGFIFAAKFLHKLNIYQQLDVPYPTQLIPLAVILSDLGKNRWSQRSTLGKLTRWYWCGVFGELYGSSIDTRMAWDVMQVPEWIRKRNSEEPWTIRDAAFQQERLETIKSRNSAAYKGVNALLMKQGAVDLINGQKFSQSVYFDEQVDIHHIFPRKWCENKKYSENEYNSIINKTPLSKLTNILLGGVAPSRYLKKLQDGRLSNSIDPVSSEDITKYLESHLIDQNSLRRDKFREFMNSRKMKLYCCILDAMGKSI